MLAWQPAKIIKHLNKKNCLLALCIYNIYNNNRLLELECVKKKVHDFNKIMLLIKLCY